MKKLILTVLVSTSFFLEAAAQINPDLNTSNFYDYNIAFHNPAGIAYPHRIQGAVGIHYLYPGLSGDNLRNNIASYIHPISNDMAIGLRGSYFTSQIFQQGCFSFLFNRKILNDLLSLGLNANLLTYSYNRDQFQLVDPGDPVIALGTSKVVPSMGMGILSKPLPWLLLGFSTDHLNRPDISIDDSGIKKNPVLKMGMSVNAYPFMPQIDLKKEGSELSFQAGIRQFFMDKNLDLYAGYDLNDAFLEVNFMPGQFGFSYNYQHPLSEHTKALGGSHRFTFIFSHGGFPKPSSLPSIKLRNPKISDTTSPTIMVAGDVKNKDGITAVELIKNGKLEKKIVYEDRPEMLALMQDVPLDEGKNEIQVVAYGEKRQRTKKIRVTYTATPPQIFLLSPAQAVMNTGIYRLHARINDKVGLESAEVFVNNQEFKTYTYPDRIQNTEIVLDVPLIEGENSILLSAKNDKGKENIASAFVKFQKPPISIGPPTIAIISPKDSITVTSSNIIKLECHVENVASPDDIIIEVNENRLVTRDIKIQERTDKGLMIRKYIDLNEGRNIIEVYAFNKVGKTHHELTVFCNPLLEKSIYNKTWAFIIGIDNYKDPFIGNLNKAVSDAKQIEKTLKEDFQFDNVVPLYNGEATKDRISSILEDRFAKSSIGDGIVFFFAGHGETRDTDYGELGYILPYDSDRNAASTWISMDDIKRSAKIAKAKHVFYVMDCCYSGLLLTRRGARSPGSADKKARDVLTAGGKGEEDVDGIFMPRFIEGLLGKADYDQNFYVTSREIGLYVSQAIPEDARVRGWKQNPQYGKLIFEEGEFFFKRKLK